MEIIIEKIKIQNFKGVTSFETELSKSKNIFEGENGIGKTTILDSITWCLFGKNFADEKKFKILPIIDGETKNELTPSVELVLNNITIERSWINSNSVIKLDGVKFAVREFENYLKDNFNINAEEFKSLSNIEYMANLNWKDLRNIIMSLIGEITNEEVYEKCDCSLITDKIESVGVEKTADDIRETKSRLNDNIKKILGNIDQKNQDIESLVVDKNEQKELVKEKEKIKKQIDEHNELSNKKNIQDGEVNKLEQLKADMKTLELTIQKNLELKVEYQSTYDNSNVDITIEKSNKKKLIDSDIEMLKKDIISLDLEKTTLINDRAELEKQYSDELAKEVKVVDDICTSCGQSLPQNRLEEVLANLKQEQKDKVNKIVEVAKLKKLKIEDIDTLIDSKNKKIEELEESKVLIDKQGIDTDNESDIQKTMKDRIAKIDLENEELENNKASLNINIEYLEGTIAKHEVIELSSITDLQEELETITEKLAISSVLTEFKDQLKKLEAEHKQLIEDKETLNIKEQQLIAFNSAKSLILKERVKNNFKMVDFITQEETKEGKLIETFKLALDGIEYSSLNHGHRVLLSLDLIDNIQRLKDKRLPILVDGLGEVTRLPEIGTQLIGCRAKFQTNKKIEMVKE